MGRNDVFKSLNWLFIYLLNKTFVTSTNIMNLLLWFLDMTSDHNLF